MDETIDLDDLIKDFQYEDPERLIKYLFEVWKDLATRSSNKTQGIDKLTFSRYYELPGIINDRLFSVMDSNSNNFLDPKEFIGGLITLFTKQFDELSDFIFKFYDLNKDGLINKEDVRVVLSYVPLQKKYNKKI